MFCKSCGKEVDINAKFCVSCGTSIALVQHSKRIVPKKIVFLVLALLILTVGILLFFLIKRDYFTKATSDQEIASSVVNIYCLNVYDEYEEEGLGGSGTILTKDGLVLTNAHIIPGMFNEKIKNTQSTDGEVYTSLRRRLGLMSSKDEAECVVILPDPTTGAPKEMYTAYPIVTPYVSDQYDLAFVQINDVFIDENGVAQGDYPKIFPTYDSDNYCKSENVVLGEHVRVYGYPEISGGYALTITDGVVSSLLVDEGLIMTSAKISHGNSGGLAVDQDGCRIGIPSMVTGDENESLGIIISNDLIYKFMNEVIKSDDN